MSSFDGERLRAARKRRRLSRQQLGSTVGVDGRQIGHWEHGKGTPGPALVAALADALLIIPASALGRQKNRQPSPPAHAGGQTMARTDRRGRR